jgi:hypothetical protein
MAAMKELATELQLYWEPAEDVSHFQRWSRILPNGDLAVIIADEHAYLFVEGAMIGSKPDTLAGVLHMAGEIARQQLAHEAETWAA